MGISLREYMKESLLGVSGLIVIFEDIKDDARAAGVDITVLQADVEMKLSGAGIPILSHEEWRITPGHPWLYVSVNTMPYASAQIFSIDLQVKQDVYLKRQADMETSATTWEIGSIGFVDTQYLAVKIRESLSTHLDESTSDFAAVNHSS
jgi:hypothetical protein